MYTVLSYVKATGTFLHLGKYQNLEHVSARWLAAAHCIAFLTNILICILGSLLGNRSPVDSRYTFRLLVYYSLINSNKTEPRFHLVVRSDMSDRITSGQL